MSKNFQGNHKIKSHVEIKNLGNVSVEKLSSIQNASNSQELAFSVVSAVVASIALKGFATSKISNGLMDTLLSLSNEIPFSSYLASWLYIYPPVLFLKTLRDSQTFYFDLHTEKQERLFFLNYSVKWLFNKLSRFFSLLLGRLSWLLFTQEEKSRLRIIFKAVIIYMTFALASTQENSSIFFANFIIYLVSGLACWLTILTAIHFILSTHEVDSSSRNNVKRVNLSEFVDSHLRYYRKNINDPALIGRGFSVFIALHITKLLIAISEILYKISPIRKSLDSIYRAYRWIHDNFSYFISRFIQLAQSALEFSLNIYLIYTLREIVFAVYDGDILSLKRGLLIASFLFFLVNILRIRSYLKKVEKESLKARRKNVTRKSRKIGLAV